MLIPFKKMNAQGNDFVILDHFANQALDVDFPRLAQDICDRHFGVGADGLVILEPCADGDARMIIFNNDGTRAEMCGSALRCVSFMMMQKTHKDQVDIVTDSGLKQAKREGDFITVNLGKPELIRQKMHVDEFCGDLVDIGNPHYIVFQEDISRDPHLEHGAKLEHHPAFSRPVNVHFVQILERDIINLKIWEHACGATLACGTGAASAVFAGIQRGCLASKVAVNVPGGKIIIQATETGEMLLIGTVSESFQGCYPWKI